MYRLALVLATLLAPVSIRATEWKIELGAGLPEPLIEALDREVFKGGRAPAALLLNFTDCRSDNCGPLLGALEEFIVAPLTGQSVGVVAIAAGMDASAIRAVRSAENLTFPIIPDVAGSLLSLAAEPHVPLVLVIDADGKVVYRHAGWRPGREAEFRMVLETVAAGNPLPPRLRGTTSAAPFVPEGALLGKPAPEVHTPHWIIPPKVEREGRFLLVEFWATWCGPCISTKNTAEPLYARFSDRLYSVAISNEEVETVRDFVAARRWTQTIAVDPQDRTRRTTGLNYFPSAFLAKPDGTVIWQGHPGELWMENAARLEQLLSEDAED